MRVALVPKALPDTHISNGVEIVVSKMWQHLPQAGVTLVHDNEPHDIRAVHIDNDGDIDVLHVHGLYLTGRKDVEGWMFSVNRKVIDSVRKSRFITVPSTWVAELFAHDMGFWPIVIPHGIDIEDFPEPSHQAKSVVLWNKNRTSDVCDPRPVNALAAIMPGFNFATTFGVATSNVAVLGKVPHPQMIKALYSKGGVYLATTKETFGVGTLEAMAAGLPVLAWNWGATPQIVQHGVTGYVVEPENIEESRLGIEYIMDNYTALSMAARQEALKYNWPDIMQQYVAVYQMAYDQAQEDVKPLVSVIIPCYNYHQYVTEAINSVKIQTYDNWECTLVDDGSTDGSAEVIYAAIEGDYRFKLVKQLNCGVAQARNRGAIESKGRYFTFLDADDVLLPNFITDLLKGFGKDRTMGVAYGRMALIDHEGKPWPVATGWPTPYSATEQLAKHNQVPSCSMVRREAFFRVGGFRQHTAPCEDAEFWARIPLVGFNCIMATNNEVYKYRIHKQAATATIKRGKADEPDWLQYIAVHNGAPQPFASIIPPANGKSHPVGVFDQPLISVVIPCGNAHGYLLRDAIESVMAQSDYHWEVIVVDDTDDGDLGTRGYYPYSRQYPFVRWIRSPKLHNVSAARNAGAAASRGKYLVFLDADDYMLPDFLKATYAIQKECQGDGSIVYTDWISAPKMEPHIAENWSLERLMSHALFAVTFMHTKAIWKEVGGFSEDVDLWEDWDYTLKLAMAGAKGIRVPKQLFVYRYQTGNRRNESLANKEELLQQIRGKFSLIVPRKRKG